MAKKTIGVLIGRMQPLHLGHVHVLENALKKYDSVLILVGSAFISRSIKNPFTFRERKEMIYSWTEAAGYWNFDIQPLRDQPYNDAKWIQSVQEAVQEHVENSGYDEPEIYITGSHRDESTWYLSAFPQYKLDLKEKVPAGEDLSATNLRQRLFSGTSNPETWNDVPQSTKFFLKHFQQTSVFKQLCEEYEYIENYKRSWTVAPFAPTFLTVDAVVIQSGHVLLIERARAPGKGLWALPGGFVDQKEKLEDAVIRELIEETGIKVQAKILSRNITAREIFDDPNRSLRGRTVTTAYLFELDDTLPLPKVKGQNAPLHETGGEVVLETAKAFWLPISEARANSQNFFEDHHSIIDVMLGRIST